MNDYQIDYFKLFSKVADKNIERKIEFLAEELPYHFYEKYLLMTPRLTNLCRLSFKGFEYIYDDYSQLEASGIVPYSPTIESRVVGVLGRSRPTSETRDAYRLQGWVGETKKYLGEDTDKGHFMAHKIGGGLEINIFAQNRGINRGWSERGKIYRAMERYCARHPNIFCFNHPIYREDNSRPCMFDFGVLKSCGNLWVESFEN
jgi:hypothetical protein